MIKLVMMVRRRKGLTPAQFQDHYETTHVPLALATLTPLRAYVRNYVERPLSGGTPAFDAMTELWFEDEQGLRDTMAIAGSPAGQRLREDEETFMDRAATAAILMTERSSILTTPVTA